jgi:hypothetical protein
VPSGLIKASGTPIIKMKSIPDRLNDFQQMLGSDQDDLKEDEVRMRTTDHFRAVCRNEHLAQNIRQADNFAAAL